MDTKVIACDTRSYQEEGQISSEVCCGEEKPHCNGIQALFSTEVAVSKNSLLLPLPAIVELL